MRILPLLFTILTDKEMDKEMKKLLSPSILACDIFRFKAQLDDVSEGGAQLLHIDIMDGHFVPNLSYGPSVCSAISKNSSLPLDVHLMISNPSQHIDTFAKAGASYLTIHAEVGSQAEIIEILMKIRSLGVHPAVSIKPKTSIDTVLPFLPYIDMVLLMTVEPGFGGQAFVSDGLSRISELRKLLDELAPSVDLEIDGGVTLENVAQTVKAGANVIVAGSAIFGANDIVLQTKDFLAQMNL